MRPITCIHWVIFWLLCTSQFVVTFAADDALPAEIQPAHQADFSPDGLLTWWLVSPPISAPANSPAPSNSREGEAVFNGNATLPGAWSLNAAGVFYNDFRSMLNGQPGSLYASTRLNSLVGGQRFFYVRTYCAVKIYLDGKLLESKPQPEATSVVKLPLNLPKGLSELTLEVVPRGDNCMIQCFLHDGRGNNPPQKPVPGDSIVLASQKGKLPDANTVALNAFTLTAQTPFVAPGGKSMLVATIQGSLPRGVSALSVRWADAPGAKENPITIGTPFQTEYIAPAEARGVYEARLEFLVQGKPIGVKSVALICPEGFAKDIAAFEKEWLERSTKSKQSMPNTKLAIEKLKLFVEGILAGTVDPDSDVAKELSGLITRIRDFMPIEEQGKDPYSGKSGYIERGYTSAIDDGVQPFITAVPENAVKENAKKFPLVVFLHGYDPNMNKHRWWEAKDYAAVCARNNCFLAIPFGRLNSDFQSVGEVDVLDVIKEMKAHYRIDPDRVYLCGISMGGMGVYSIAAHYPDEFAAAMILAGRADSPLQNGTALDNFVPFKQWLIQTDNPISLCENLINLPMRIYHGQDDNVVPATQAMRMSAGLKKAGCNANLLLVPGGHRSGFDILHDDEPVRWLLTNKRNPTPAKRHLKTYSLQFIPPGAGVETTDDLAPIDIEWKGEAAIAKSEIIQKSANVLNFGFYNLGSYNGKKSPDLCGPVRQAICAPFTIVYGTKGVPAANELNKKNAARFEDEWFQFTRSHGKIKADIDVTPDEKRDRNLFLFGEEQDNALHAELARDLPISVKNGTVTIGEKSVPLDGKGILYIYPSAFSGKKRAVVICAGAPYGEKIGVNHKLDLIPDFLLYEGTVFDTDGTSSNSAVCAGFFTNEWKLDAKRMWWAAKK